MSEPLYLTDQSVETIKARLRTGVPSIDATEGSAFGDLEDTFATELFDTGVREQVIGQQAFLSGATGSRLDARAAERNLTRNAATPATVVVRFTGTVGLAVAIGTRVSTVQTSESPARIVATTAATVIGAGGTGDAPATAIAYGAAWNAAAGALTVMLTFVEGVSAVTNPSAAVGGTDAESDERLRERVLYDVRTVSSGGNLGDYERWARDVDGVGDVIVVPQQFGPGTVELYVIDASGAPATQAIVDAVQADIAPRFDVAVEAEDALFVRTGAGITVVDLVDDTLTTVRLGPPGAVASHLDGAFAPRLPLNAAGLPSAGIWQARARIKANPVTGGVACLRLAVWNTTRAAFAKTTQFGAVDAVLDLTAAQIGSAWREASVDVFWNGADVLSQQVIRQVADSATAVDLDRVRYTSAFSADAVGVYGRAPVGARVTVHAATAVPIAVAATLHLWPGYEPGEVIAAAIEAIRDAIVALALSSDKTVRYIPLGGLIYDVEGVQFVSAYTVNGATADVTVAVGAVGTAGTITVVAA